MIIIGGNGKTQSSALGAAGQQIMAASVRSTGSGKHPVSFKAFVDDLEVRKQVVILIFGFNIDKQDIQLHPDASIVN